MAAILAAVEGGILPPGPAHACRAKLASPGFFRRARCPALRQARTPAATTCWCFQVRPSGKAKVNSMLRRC